ncbi:MAG: HAD family hydrolase [Caldilineaceae bacterium]
MIKAIIFDFDGLILDTESPEYQSWQEIYADHGCSLPLSKWGQLIGTANTFDPYAYLAEQSGRAVDRPSLQAKHRSRAIELIESLSPLPGVEDYIADAKRLGLRLAVASSSRRDWVEGHLTRLGLAHHFDAFSCADDVERVKPDPAIYRIAAERLGVAPSQAIALEDSPNGALAAKRAGIYCVTIPNPLTQQLVFAAGDMRLSSMESLSLGALLEQVNVARATINDG